MALLGVGLLLVGWVVWVLVTALAAHSALLGAGAQPPPAAHAPSAPGPPP